MPAAYYVSLAVQAGICIGVWLVAAGIFLYLVIRRLEQAE